MARDHQRLVALDMMEMDHGTESALVVKVKVVLYR